MRALACLAAVAACGGEIGTIQLELVTEPGSTLLADVQRLRVTITEPRQVVEAERGDSGFDLALDVEAIGGNAFLIVEGFDGGGVLIASGSSPPFPVSAINATIAVYVARPLTIGLSPARLPAPRRGVSTTPLTYGIAIAGGIDAANVTTDDMFIYNAYDHSLLEGAPLPSARAFPTLATGANDAVYIVGGFDTNLAATGTVFRFDTTAPPNGVYSTFQEHPELARGGEIAVPLALERHIITGTPPIEMTLGALAPTTDVASLLPTGASVTDDGVTFALVGGAPVVRFFETTRQPTTETAGALATAAGLPGGFVAFVSIDSTRDLLVFDATTGEATRRTDALSVPRAGAAVAATARHLIVASGVDGDPATATPHATADILDATTLALITTVPCTPRLGATATAFLNGQIVIAGGSRPETDAIELFTPGPPDL